MGRSDRRTIKNRRTTVKRKQYGISTRSRVQKITALIPRNWRKVSKKHRGKFKQLLEIWKSDTESMTIVSDNGMCFQKKFLIGSGSYGTEVYICLGSDGIERAIKRLPKLQCQKFLKNERDILTSQNVIDSPRVVKYCFYNDTSHDDFGYLILSLREQNLEEYIKEKGAAIKESRARKMIHQVLEGLLALHAREPRILHRDLKPTNILVDKNGDLVLSDFGIGRFFPEQGAATCPTKKERGSFGWVPYECVDWDRLDSDEMGDPSDAQKQFHWEEKSDIQVAGMLAFYILTRGKHPFGKVINQYQNMRNDDPKGLSKLKDPVVKDLLSQMLAQKLRKRPYVEEALLHPYFLTRKEQMRFVQAVGNEPGVRTGDPNCAVSTELDNRDPSNPRSSLLPNDWKAVIDPRDLTILCKGGRGASTYNRWRYTHCLTFIRNARLHWYDQPRPGIKATRDKYFLQLFPTLPLVLHQIIRKHRDWKTRESLKDFFPIIDRRREQSDADMDAD